MSPSGVFAHGRRDGDTLGDDQRDRIDGHGDLVASRAVRWGIRHCVFFLGIVYPFPQVVEAGLVPKLNG